MNLNAEKVCLAVIQWGTYLILLTPLVVVDGFFFLFVGPKTIYFWALVEIIFAAWLFLIFFRSEYRPRRNAILIVLSVFLFCLILSTVFGVDPSKSFWSNFERMTGLLTWFHLFAFFIVLSSVFKKKSDWHKIFALSILTATAVSLLSIFPKLGLPDILKNLPTQEGTTLGNTSFLATYLLFNVFLALYLFLKGRDKLKILSAVGFVLITLALLSNPGYAAIISFFLGLVLLFSFWLIFQRGSVWRLVGVTLLGILLIAVIVSLFLIFQPESSIHQAIVKHFHKARFIIWQISSKGWQDRPWFGWGPENFDLPYYKHFNPAIFSPISSPKGQVWFDRAHNIFFDSLVTIGILGLLAYLGIFASAFYLLWKRYFRENRDRSNFWLVGIFSVTLIAYFVQNLTVFDMIGSYLMFFLILAFIASLSGILAPTRSVDIRCQQTVRKRILVFFVILVLLAFSLFKFVIQPLKTDYYAMTAVRTQDSAKRLTLFRKALATSNLGRYQIREFFADSLIRKTPSQGLRPELDFVIVELQKSTKNSPLNFRSHLKLGQLYNFYGRLESDRFFDAEIVLKKAIELSPTNQHGYWALADTQMGLGERKKAIFLLEKAIELEPRLDKSRQKLRELKEMLGE